MIAANLDSSNLERAGYEDKSHKLFLRFKSGVSYAYEGVMREVFDALLLAESHGQYFHRYIRSQFRYERLNFDPFL